MSEEKTFHVEVTLERDFIFKVDFGLGGVDDLIMDEPEPLGESKGPNASKVLAAAMGNCLSASLLFCLQKSRVEVSGMKTAVKGITARNEEGRWRIKEVCVDITPQVEDQHRKQLERCIEIFEQFCIVSQSIKEGIPINVNVQR